MQIAGGSRVEFGAPSDFFVVPLTDSFVNFYFLEKTKNLALNLDGKT